MDDFNEDTCEVYLYDVENVVHSTKTNVKVQELFETIETNKAESKNATQEKGEDFNGLDYIWSEQRPCVAPGC